MGASASQTGPSQAEPEVSALRASVPSAWFAWPVMTTFEEVEVELMMRDGCTFRTNAQEFEYWYRRPGSDMCDDIMAFRIVGLMTANEDSLHALATKWQDRHGYPAEAAFGAASAMSARSAETEGLSPQDASAVGEAETPKDQPQ